MAFPKKKEKKTSPQLEYLRKQREQEWDDAMKKTGNFFKTESIIVERKKEMARMRKKYGIKKT